MNWAWRGSPAEADCSLRIWSGRTLCTHFTFTFVSHLTEARPAEMSPGSGLWQWWGSSESWRCFTAVLCWQLILVRIDKLRDSQPLQEFWSLVAACLNDFPLQFQLCFLKWLQQILLCALRVWGGEAPGVFTVFCQVECSTSKISFSMLASSFPKLCQLLRVLA